MYTTKEFRTSRPNDRFAEGVHVEYERDDLDRVTQVDIEIGRRLRRNVVGFQLSTLFKRFGLGGRAATATMPKTPARPEAV